MKFIGEYEYPDFVYTGYHDKFKANCLKHGIFYKTIATHLDKRRPQGCPQCSKEAKAEAAKIYYDIEQIRTMGYAVFGNRYYYPDQPKVTLHDKIRIICPVHGEFTQVFHSHMDVRHCNECSYVERAKNRTKSIEEVRNQIIARRGNKFDLSELEYSSCKDKSFITCNTCKTRTEEYIKDILYEEGELCRVCFPKAGESLLTKSKKDGHTLDTFLCDLYLIEFKGHDEHFIKIGITSNTLKKRFRRSHYEMHEIYLFTMSLRQAMNIEKEMLKEFSEFQYIPLRKFKGKTECFIPESFEKIKNVLLARNSQVDPSLIAGTS